MVMLTSKQVLAQTGISRATLNNYIALGLLPRPTVAAPEAASDTAPRIGFFADDVIDRIMEVQRLKQSGKKMQDIVEHFQDGSLAPMVASKTLTLAIRMSLFKKGCVVIVIVKARLKVAEPRCRRNRPSPR